VRGINKPSDGFSPPETFPEFFGCFLAQISLTSHLINHEDGNSLLNFLFEKWSFIFKQYRLHSSRMPPTLASLCRHLHRVQNFRNLPETKSLVPQLTHFKNGFLFTLVLHMASFLDLLPLGQSSDPFSVTPDLSNRDIVNLEILQNRCSGGKTCSYRLDLLKGMKSLGYWPAENS